MRGWFEALPEQANLSWQTLHIDRVSWHAMQGWQVAERPVASTRHLNNSAPVIASARIRRSQASGYSNHPPVHHCIAEIHACTHTYIHTYSSIHLFACLPTSLPDCLSTCPSLAFVARHVLVYCHVLCDAWFLALARPAMLC